MPTKHTRINIPVDKGMLAMITRFAKSEETSLSSAAKELIKLGLEMQEDWYFSRLSDKRLKEGGKRIKHKDAWKNVLRD